MHTDTITSARWPDLEHHSVELRRGVAQGQNLLPKSFVRYLRGGARQSLAFDANIDGGIFDHVLTPVFALNLARRGIEIPFEIEKSQFHSPRLAAFSSYRRKIGDYSRSVLEVHSCEYTFPNGS
jgi:hypothetical protein